MWSGPLPIELMSPLEERHQGWVHVEEKLCEGRRVPWEGCHQQATEKGFLEKPKLPASRGPWPCGPQVYQKMSVVETTQAAGFCDSGPS